MFENINNLLPTVLNKYNISNAIVAEKVVRIANRVIYHSFGYETVRAVKFTNNILYLNVNSSAVSNEVKVRLLEIQNQINDELDVKIAIEKIILRL